MRILCSGIISRKNSNPPFFNLVENAEHDHRDSCSVEAIIHAEVTTGVPCHKSRMVCDSDIIKMRMTQWNIIKCLHLRRAGAHGTEESLSQCSVHESCSGTTGRSFIGIESLCHGGPSLSAECAGRDECVVSLRNIIVDLSTPFRILYQICMGKDAVDECDDLSIRHRITRTVASVIIPFHYSLLMHSQNSFKRPLREFIFERIH